jgi:hypothetical protein
MVKRNLVVFLASFVVLPSGSKGLPKKMEGERV